MLALGIKDLCVSYGTVEAVRNVDIEVQTNSITVLLGANGAGKSTIMRTTMGLVARQAGSISVFGEPLNVKHTAEIVRGGMTLSPEGRHIFKGLSVEENLAMGASADRRLISAARGNMDRAFEMFPILHERRRQKAGSLSGGEQQMLAIARALMSEPKILLLDEPSLGLAPIIIDQIFDLIVRLRDQGLSILLVEQNAQRALEIGDYGYVMTAGRITTSGPASEILSSGNLSESYLGN